MTCADTTHDRQLRCQRQLLRLRMLVLNQDATALTRHAADIREATNTVIAEVAAMGRAALEAGRPGPGAETFLWVRVTRLAMAADDAVTAARSGDLAALDAHLRHLETLTSAIWTVQDAVYGQEAMAHR